MTDTTQAVTSDAKLCAQCASPFDSNDDRRYSQCRKCRNVEPTHTANLAVTAIADDAPVDPGVVPLKLDIDVAKPSPPEPRSYYWFGVTEDCPWSYVNAGGEVFQKTFGEIVDQPGGKQECRDHAGKGSQTHYLTDKHVALILERVAQRVVRAYRVTERKLYQGGSVKQYTGRMLTKQGAPNRPYNPQEGDLPLGQFLWMIKVRHKGETMQNPPTLVARNW